MAGDASTVQFALLVNSHYKQLSIQSVEYFHSKSSKLQAMTPRVCLLAQFLQLRTDTGKPCNNYYGESVF